MLFGARPIFSGARKGETNLWCGTTNSSRPFGHREKLVSRRTGRNKKRCPGICLRAGPPAEGVCHSTSDKPLANASFSRKNSVALFKTRCTFIQKCLVSRFSAGKPACSPHLGELLGIARHPDGSRAARAPSVGRETQGTQSPPSFCASRSRRAPLEPLSRRPFRVDCGPV